MRYVILGSLGFLVAVAPAVPSDLSGRQTPPQELVVEPAQCLDVPEGAQRLHLSGTTHNQPPVRPGDPDFPADVCASLEATREGLGSVRGFLTSDAVLMGTHVGEASMHAEACLFGPPPTVVPAMTITTSGGDMLMLVAHATRATDSPPPPDNEAAGSGTVTGGSGRFAGASGEFNLNAKSHGATQPGSNVATLRDIDLCGYIFLLEPGR